MVAGAVTEMGVEERVRAGPGWSGRVWSVVPSGVPGLLMLLVGWRGAATPALGWDEYATVTVATRTLPQILNVAGWTDATLTPYYLVMHAWIRVFGDSELALRAPSIIAMAIGVALVGVLGRRLFTPVTGLVAALLLVLLPAMTRYAQEARPYAITFMLVTLATLLLYRAIDRPGWGRWSWYGLVVLLVGLMQMLGLLILAGHAYVVLTRQRRNWRRWFVVTTLAVAGSMPLILIGMAQQKRQLGWLPAVDWDTLRGLPGELVWQPAAGWLLFGLALAAVRPRHSSAMESAVLSVAPPLLLIVASVLAEPLWWPRYVLYVLATVALLAASVLTGWWRPAVALAVVLVLVVPEQRELREASSHAPDFRWVAATIVANQRPGDGVVYATADHKWTRAWTDYYLRDQPMVPRDVLLERSAADAGRLLATECADVALCAGSPPRLWLVQLTRGRPLGDDLLVRAGRPEQLLREDYRLVRTWQQGWRVVSLYERVGE